MAWPLIPILAAAGTALSLPSILDASRRLGEQAGFDPFGRKRREATVAGEDAVSLLLEEMGAAGEEANQLFLRDELAPFNGVRGVNSNAELDEMRDQRGLQDVLEARQTDLARLSQVMGGPSLEEMAMELGY